MVERHLAKVNVAGSNLVSRSIKFRTIFILFCQWAEWRYSQVVRHGSAKPSPPVQIWVAPPKEDSAPLRCGVIF